ncbi:PAS domain S-box protein [Calothrix anomala]
MQSVAQQMASNSQTLLQSLVDIALDLCIAGSTGVSLLEKTPNGEEVFRWNVLAGALAQYLGGTTKRDFSPCGVCLDRGTPQLFSHPERYFTYFQAANTPIVEGLVLPLIGDRHVFGTIWIMSHDEKRHFDSEDVRIMTSLADFTATALLLQQRQTGELLAANAALEAEIAERKLSQAQLYALIANLPGGAAFVVDRDLRYLLAEGEALAHAGFKREDFVGRTIFEVLPPELAANYEPTYRQALAGEPFEVEHDAHEHTYISRGTPLRAENGEIYAVLVVSYDITERKQVEQALRESEARLALELADARQLQFISSQLVQEENIDALYEQILQAAIAIMRSDMGSMQMLHPDSNELQLLAWKGFDPASAAFWEWVRVDSDSSCGMALRTGERAIVPDIEKSEFMAGSGDLDSYRLSGVRAVQTTPLISRSGCIVGMISTHWQEPHQPSERELGLLDVLARQAADLIEQWQAEGALRESEARLQSIANLVPDLLWNSEPDGSTNWYNQRWMEYTGQTFQQAIGWGWIDAIHPDDRQGSERRYREAVEQGMPLLQEHRIRRHDGAYRWFVVKASPLKDESGKVIKMYGAATDIHEQWVALEALRESEEKFRTLANTAPALIWFNDAQGNNLFINQHFLDFTGKSAEQIRGEGWQELVHPDDAENYIADYLAAVREQRSWHNRNRIRRHDGVWRWHDNYAQPLLNADGVYLGHVGVTIDNTDAIEAEIALRESQEKYRSLFNSLDEAFAVVEVIANDSGEWNDFLFLEVNPAFVKQTGMEYPVGRKATELLGTPNPQWAQVYGRVAQTGEPIRFEQGEATLGRVFDLYVSRLGEEGSRRVAVLFADITKRKRAEETLRENEARQAFLLKLSDILQQFVQPNHIKAAAMRLLGEHLGVSRAQYHECDSSGEYYSADGVGYAHGLPLLDLKYRIDNFGTFVNEDFAAGRPYRSDDLTVDPRVSAEEREAYRTYQIGAGAGVPLIRGGKLVAILAVHDVHPHQWTDLEMDLIRETAERIWTPLERARAEEGLRGSEAKYRTLFTSIDEGFTLLEMIPDESGHPVDFRIVETNPVWEQQTGLTDAVGKTLLEIAPNFEQQLLDLYSDVLISGRGKRTEYYTASVDSWYTVFASRIGSEGNRQVAVVFNDISDRKRTEEQQAFLLKFSDSLRAEPDADSVARRAVRMLAEHLHLDRVWLSEVFEQQDISTIDSEYHRPDLSPMSGVYRLSDYPETMRQIATQPMVVHDVASDPDFSDSEKALLAQLHLQALLVVSLRKG